MTSYSLYFTRAYTCLEACNGTVVHERAYDSFEISSNDNVGTEPPGFLRIIVTIHVNIRSGNGAAYIDIITEIMLAIELSLVDLMHVVVMRTGPPLIGI